MPNNVAPGNHDLGAGGTTSAYFDQYFPPSRYDLPANPWYGGWLGEEPGQDDYKNRNNYELFTAGGIDFLIVHLEVDVPDYALAWADEIIGRYPDRKVIVSTHAYLSSSGNYGAQATSRSDGNTGQEVWDQLISPNCNIFMVVNGHSPGENDRTDTNSCGGDVHQIVTDYQGRANGGDGWLRYYTFEPDENRDRGVHLLDESRHVRDRLEQPLHARLRHERCWIQRDRLGRRSVRRLAGHPLVRSRSEHRHMSGMRSSDDGVNSVVGPTWSFTTGETPNWDAYVDLRSSDAATTMQQMWSKSPRGPAGSPIEESMFFDLIDINSGSTVGATLQVDNSGINTTSDNGGDFSSGPGFDVFDGIVDAQGVYSYEEATDEWQINIGGLDSTKRYEVVVSSNRDQTGFAGALDASRTPRRRRVGASRIRWHAGRGQPDARAPADTGQHGSWRRRPLGVDRPRG